MPNYQQQQEKLFNKIESSANQGKQLSTIVPKVDDYSQDKRLSLTGVAFLPSELQQKISTDIIEPLKEADPEQYYYSPNSLHLTIKNIRASNYPLTFNQSDIKKSQTVFKKIIPMHKIFQFELKDFFTLPTSLAIRAYSNSSLKDLVLDLHQKLIAAGVPDDKEYASEEVFFGNITFCRFTKTPSTKFQQLALDMENAQIGVMNINEVSLITTNPGCHPEHTKIIDTYRLR